MKKLTALLITLTLVLSVVPAFTVSAANEISVYIDGVPIALPTSPLNINGTTLVPMRALFEALGAEVTWDSENQTAYGEAPGVYVAIIIDDPYMIRNFVDVPLTEPARIINGSTLIPLRAVSECFGMQVDWDAATNSVFLTSLNTIQKTDWNETHYYIGEVFSSGYISGYGILYEKATDIATAYGYFENGSIVNGLQYYTIGEEYYYGEFKSGVPDGYGTYFWADGDYYTGECKNGLSDGYGAYFWADGDYYIGEFKNNVKHGTGTYYWANGEYYTGEWKNDVKDGYGTYYYADGGYYIGEFKSGSINGQGERFYTDGTYYVGEFINGFKNGYGELYNPDGSYYCGDFLNGTMHGLGEYHSGYGEYYGDYYIGEFKNGLKDGYGTYYFAEGYSITGYWSNDDLQTTL